MYVNETRSISFYNGQCYNEKYRTETGFFKGAQSELYRVETGLSFTVTANR